MKRNLSVAAILLTLLTLHSCGQDTGNSPVEVDKSPKKIFVTYLEHNGYFGSTPAAATAGADAFCNADQNRPAGRSKYKALIASSVRNTSTDWPLKPSTTYHRADGSTVIGTTNASGVFAFPLTNTFSTFTNYYAWTGLEADWNKHTANCVDWTNGTSGGNGIGATPNATSNAAIHAVVGGCHEVANYRIICVQQ